jgi:hypothetical protein
VVPSTLVGVLIFLALLGPGYLYVRRVERLEALHKVSPFRESISIAAVSVLCNGAALVLFAMARILLPSVTPDVGAIVRQEPYFAANYQRVATAAIVVYVVAFLIAFVVSHPKVRDADIWRIERVRKLIGVPVLDSRSAWSRLFDVEKDDIVRAGCELDDGSWIDGWVLDWNAQPEEDSDRTLTLHEPIRVRAKGRDCAQLLTGVHFVVIANDRIVRLDVTLVDIQNKSQFDAEYQTPAEV